MVRVRHYTRVSSMRKIIVEQRVVARDQNKVFVERADRRKLAPRDAEERYGLDQGKANAYVEFDIEPDLLHSQYNPVTRCDESYVVGNVDLSGREPQAFFNF